MPAAAPALADLAAAVRALYRQDPRSAPARIEALLGASLASLDPAAQAEALAGLACHFAAAGAAPGAAAGIGPGATPGSPFGDSSPPPSAAPPGSAIDAATLRTLLGRLLRRGAPRTDLPADQLLEKITAAMTVIFESLNELTQVMQSTLFGRDAKLETIRGVIGAVLEEQGEGRSIEDFLEQIREAFLVGHRAAQAAAAEKLLEILEELEPASLLARAASGLRRGPLARAEAFALFAEKHALIRQWLTSERFREDWLRALEAHCRKGYSRREENR